tara:strand:+ start:200 stop:355 length:156 start_codon:yes stop_codon:yes gene_type:complete
MGQNIYSAPLGKINDGMNDILFVTSNKSRKQLFSMLLSAEDGNKYFMKSKN